LPDISKINNVAVADISKLDSITFADGQKVNNQSVSLVSDAHTLISSQDAGGATSVTFSSLGSTDVLMFDIVNFDPTDKLMVQATTSSYSYNVPMTTTFFRAYHTEADSSSLAYAGGADQAQGTNYQQLSATNSSDADSNSSGSLMLYGHSSTTFVKHFTSKVASDYVGEAGAYEAFVAGYFNTTEAITAIQFKANSGGAFNGTFNLYGVATS
jgi:hypothetical protein